MSIPRARLRLGLMAAAGAIAASSIPDSLRPSPCERQRPWRRSPDDRRTDRGDPPPTRGPEAYSDRGSAYGVRQRYEEAIADFDVAIRLKPEVAQYRYDRGLAWDREGAYDRAIADYTEAIRFDRRYTPAYQNRGAVLGVLGDLEGAIRDDSEAIRLDPKNVEAQMQSGHPPGEEGGQVLSVAFSPDGRRLVCAGIDGKLDIRAPGP